MNDSEAKEAAKEVQDWFEEHGGVEKDTLQIKGYGCDISDEESVKKVMQDINDSFGKIDVVCNSAGIVENFSATEYVSREMELVSK